MPLIYRNGKNYSFALPDGGTLGQALVKNSNADGDVIWGDAGGAVFCYVVGSTPYASDWLSTTPSGTALTPNPKLLYLILTDGTYYNNFVRWDPENSVYVPVSDSGVIVNGTLLASGWGSNTKQQTLTFADYDSDMGGVIGMPTSATPAQKDAFAAAVIDVVAQSGNQFTFECQTIPTVDLPVTLYAGGGSGGGGGSVSGGGHVIVNSSGIEMDQREKLKFTGGIDVFDDSSNDTTVVDVSGKANLTTLAPAFDSATLYTTGDRVTNNGKLYRFIADHTGAWDIADVAEVDVDTELDGVSNSVKTVSDNVGKLADLTTTHKTSVVAAVNELDDDIGTLSQLDTTTKNNLVGAVNEVNSKKVSKSVIAPVFDDTATYAAGDKVMYGDDLYVFNKAHTGAWDAADADKTDVAPHELTSAEWSDIMPVLPGVNSGGVIFDERGTEYVVGQYIHSNGKKQSIYQKFILASGTLADQQILDSTINANNAELLSYTGFITNTAGAQYNIGYSYWSSSALRAISIINVPAGVRLDMNPQSATFNKLILKVQYIKTADTPV